MNPMSSLMTVVGPIGTIPAWVLGPSGTFCRVGSGDLDELKSLVGNLPKQIRESVDGELLAGAAPVAESKWCEAGIVADRQRLALDDTEHGAEIRCCAWQPFGRP